MTMSAVRTRNYPQRKLEQELGMLNTKETAEMLSITQITAKRWFQNGRIPAMQIEGKWRTTRFALDKLLQSS